MFQHCANNRSALRSVMVLLCAVMLGACSSSPSKEDPVAQTAKPAATGSKPATSSGGKKGEVEASVVEAPPVGPPPIPPEATAQFEKALTLLGAGDYAPATTELQRLSSAYPDYSGPLTNLGIIYLKTGRLVDAEKTLQAATKRGEPNAATYNQLGIVYRKLGRFKEADAAYSQALRIDPSYALAHLNLGVLCDMYLQQPQRALDQFELYMKLAASPDQRVAGWVKELRGRVGTPKPASEAPKEASAPASGAAQ
jgi:Flp pilus assembly protein TadD